jgi:hypothetical protein
MIQDTPSKKKGVSSGPKLMPSPLAGLCFVLCACWNPPKVIEPNRDAGLEKKNCYETLERIGFGYSGILF